MDHDKNKASELRQVIESIYIICLDNTIPKLGHMFGS